VSTPFTSRPLGTPDLDGAAALHREAFQPLGERGWAASEIADLLASPGVAGLSLQEDGKNIGFALCRVAADEAELLTIAVHARVRRRGAGRALLARMIEIARGRGAHRLFLEVGADNLAALALYRAAGFEQVGRRRAYYARGAAPAADALVMRLSLGELPIGQQPLGQQPLKRGG